MKKTIVAGVGLLAVAGAFAAKDPIIMTINGEAVPKSEFEYLYNKNSQQQINPQTIEEYVEMFKLYKMKVADAKAEGLDTLESFRKEMTQYKHELAAPYMTDSAYLYKLADEAYDRSRKEVEAYHIMLFKGKTPAQDAEMKARIDSLHQVLKNGGDFADLASRYSQDRGSSQKGGRMGYIVAGQYPYSFEVVDFALPEGEISDVVESPVGYHILKGGKSRPARGRVKVAHILKLTRNMNSEQKAKAKVSIDSIYSVAVADPDGFAELAKATSEDPGSARQGGALPYFGAGEMVEAFDSVAFAIPVGSISKPFESPFGYHIIKKLEAKEPVSKEQTRQMQFRAMKSDRDERKALIRKYDVNRFGAKHKAKVNDRAMAMLKEDAQKNGLDSTFFASWNTGANGNITIMEIDGKKIPAKEFVSTFAGNKKVDATTAVVVIDKYMETFYGDNVIAAEEDALINTVPEYRNLFKEYTDGSLLYEASVRKVWDKAAKDDQGLQRYFVAHKSDYKWTEPHVKGYFVQTVNDSVAELIKNRFKELKPEDVVETIRREFPNQVAIEKILMAKGGNPMVDHVAFGGPKAESSIAKYQTYFMLAPCILNEPEEYSDVKGLVTSDYQNEMQAAWEKELKRKYPVIVNEKVLKSIKK